MLSIIGDNKRLLRATPAHENDILFILSQKEQEVLLDDLPICYVYGQCVSKDTSNRFVGEIKNGHRPIHPKLS